MIYSQTTHEIRIDVKVTFVPEDKRPPVKAPFFWAYHVTITNQSESDVTLITRHWRIINSKGRTEQVDGDGVIGEKPKIASGGHFEYASACPLDTASGTMGGHYGFLDETGKMFDVVIPTFSLHLPNANKTLN